MVDDDGCRERDERREFVMLSSFTLMASEDECPQTGFVLLLNPFNMMRNKGPQVSACFRGNGEQDRRETRQIENLVPETEHTRETTMKHDPPRETNSSQRERWCVVDALDKNDKNEPLHYRAPPPAGDQ